MFTRFLPILVVLSLVFSVTSLLMHFRKDAEEIAVLTKKGMKILHEKEQEKAKEKQMEAIKERASELNKDPSSPFAGNPDGDVTMTYFFDYRCGYCRRGDPVLDELLEADPKLKVVYKEYPMFKNTVPARAALAAHKQGKYVEMHRRLMQNTGEFSEDVILQIAKDLKLDIKRLEADMKSKDIKDAIRKNHELAQTIDITGTPMYIIGASLMIPGTVSVDEFQKAIETVRKEQKDSK